MRLKKIFFVIFVATFIALITACSNTSTDGISDPLPATPSHDFPRADMSAYEIEGDHRFYSVTMAEALLLREDATFDGIIYFGFPSCPWCQSAIPNLHAVAVETEVDVFYVSRRQEIRDEAFEEADATMAWWLNEQIELNWLYEDDEAIRPNIFVPLVIHLRNGVVVDSHQSTVADHQPLENDSLPELTQQQADALQEIYTTIFSAVASVSPDSCEIVAIEEDGCS